MTNATRARVAQALDDVSKKVREYPGVSAERKVELWQWLTDHITKASSLQAGAANDYVNSLPVEEVQYLKMALEGYRNIVQAAEGAVADDLYTAP